MIEKYKHHGKKVFVRSDLKGKHRDFCLCFKCNKFNEHNPAESCTLANMIYSMCVKYNLVLPVWECPEFSGVAKNIGEQRRDLFLKVKCKPSFGCWMMGCGYEDNPEKCERRIWNCEKCGSENLKTPPRTGDGGFDAGYDIYDCKDCGHETIRNW